MTPVRNMKLTMKKKKQLIAPIKVDKRYDFTDDLMPVYIHMYVR